MLNQDLVGLAAGSLTTISFVPQVIQIWRTKHADDISTSMFVIFMAGVGLWLLYGIYLDALPVIIANSITLLLAATVLILKFHFHRTRP
ncbi:hypothetical protein CAP31_10855 [Sulfuriferula sp. AH1]|uniref:SemiSWEET transporter n=1 Tax=Sulfuriferula sp. AH1 TaxID=1985873 RepID=UPI000B3BA35C|nr:SemiSWEET transporter [Sulfuriferula sp. AH1]ARU32133.1 hypothetical protein CAP31_10855 [Sulfuriferula sp. AH1]